MLPSSDVVEERLRAQAAMLCVPADAVSPPQGGEWLVQNGNNKLVPYKGSVLPSQCCMPFGRQHRQTLKTEGVERKVMLQTYRFYVSSATGGVTTKLMYHAVSRKL